MKTFLAVLVLAVSSPLFALMYDNYPISGFQENQIHRSVEFDKSKTEGTPFTCNCGKKHWFTIEFMKSKNPNYVHKYDPEEAAKIMNYKRGKSDALPKNSSKSFLICKSEGEGIGKCSPDWRSKDLTEKDIHRMGDCPPDAIRSCNCGAAVHTWAPKSTNQQGKKKPVSTVYKSSPTKQIASKCSCTGCAKAKSNLNAINSNSYNYKAN